MILKPNDRILLVHRRLFEEDEVRYFIGAVDAYDGGVVKASGYSFMRDNLTGKILRKSDPRTKIVSIVSGGFLAYQLPDETNVDAVHFIEVDKVMVLTDGGSLRMNLTELPHAGKF